LGSLKNHKTKNVRKKPIDAIAVAINKHRSIMELANNIAANFQPSG